MAIAITPRLRQRLVWLGVVAGFVGVAWWMTWEQDAGLDMADAPSIDALILPGDTHSQSLEAVAATMEALRRRLDALERADVNQRDERKLELEQVQRLLMAELASSDAARRAAAQGELDRLRQEMDALGIARLQPGAAPDAAAPVALEPPALLSLPSGGAVAAPRAEAAPPAASAEAASPSPAATPAPVESEAARGPREDRPTPPRVVPPAEVQAAFERRGGVATPASLGAPPPTGGPEAPTGGVRLLATQVAAGPRRSAVGGAEVFLPSGSILSGVLLTGLDAPGGSAAKTNPVPVLLRLKHEAILPNRFGADLRECFALLSAFGDLSSERASMRGEQISCILVDGTVMQRPLKSYAVGEDGKAGVRGRVVTRQGAFIARAILVGVLDGVAQAFNDGVQISVGQSESLGGAAVSGFGSGFGSAFDRIAEWYLEQAETLFPVIEIDVGRSVDIVLTEGLEFRLDLGGAR
jgi:conjugal transfer pilus assembly protein TraB